MKKHEIKKLKRYYVEDFEDVYGEYGDQQKFKKQIKTYKDATIDDYYSVFNDVDDEPDVIKKKFVDIIRENKFLKLECLSMVMVVVVLFIGFLLSNVSNTASVYELPSLPLAENMIPRTLDTIPYDRNNDLLSIGRSELRYYELESENMVCGTEILSLAMIMSKCDPAITPRLIYDKYLDRALYPSFYNGVRIGRNPAQYFIGDPFEKGYGIFADGIYSAAIRLKTAYNLDIDILNISGVSEIELINYMKQGYFVIAWFTQNFEQPDWESETWHFPSGERYKWPVGTTSCLLVDYTNGYLIAYDPADSIRRYDRKPFIGSWQSTGPFKDKTSQAVAIKVN